VRRCPVVAVEKNSKYVRRTRGSIFHLWHGRYTIVAAGYLGSSQPQLVLAIISGSKSTKLRVAILLGLGISISAKLRSTREHK
jgi:lysophospholipid acyltransferase (LPLAT)-like uncharacterized protein